MQVFQPGGSSRQVSGDDDVRLKEACQQFAAVFWNQVLESMRKTVPKEGVLGTSFANDVFQAMLFEQYSVLLARQDAANGLGEILYHQLRDRFR